MQNSTFTRKNRKSILPLIICSLLMLGVVHSNKAFAEGSAGEQKRPPMPVMVEKVQKQNFPYRTDYPAQLSASKLVQVHARVTGIIEKQYYQEGQTVKAGQRLYQIEDRRYIAAKEQAEAMLKSADIQAKQTKVNYERVKSLRSKGSVSIQDVDDAFTAWQTALADQDAAKAKLLSAQIDLDDTTIEAEISGTIGERQMDVGDLVSPTGQNLLNTITRTNPLYANFAIADNDRETFFADVDSGLVKAFEEPKVELLNPDGSTGPEAKINYMAPQVDPETASQAIRASFDNPKQRLLPGQFVRLEVTLGEWQNMLSIPEASIVQVGAQSFVYVVKDGLAQLQPIQLAAQYHKRWLVKGGLNEGDQVIIGNLIKLRPKTPVSVIDPTKAPAGAPQSAGGK